MKTNSFIYADLSTYTLRESIAFYKRVFGWQFYKQDNGYFAYAGNRLVVGLYETPERFQQINMPHFWMSYIQVNDIAKTVASARELGGIIEMEQSIAGFGKVALIRDPQGAGFTIYEGEKLTSTRTEGSVNTLIWNELHVSDAEKIIPFYEGIFDWQFHRRDSGHFEIYSGANRHMADTWVISNAYKSKYEYWVCTFGVKSLQESFQKILANGGSLIVDEGERMLCADDSGQAFFYIQEVKSWI